MRFKLAECRRFQLLVLQEFGKLCSSPAKLHQLAGWEFARIDSV